MSTIPKEIQEEAIKRYGCPPNVSGNWTLCYREQQAFIAGYQLATDGREERHIQNFKNMTERCNIYHDQITALQSQCTEKDKEIDKWENEAKEAWRKIEIYKDESYRYKKEYQEQSARVIELEGGLKEINNVLGTVNFSSHKQMKEAIESATELSEQLLKQ